MEHGERYARAREFYDVVTGLWDSFADDAFVRDADSGIYFDPDKLHVLNHKGKYFSVRGPLNIARPVQGWPVIVQAGASDAGRQLAAETAEVVFAAGSNLANAQRFYADVKGRMKAGRPQSRASQDPARRAGRGRRQRGGGAREAGAARQPRALRQRHRLALDRARPRCVRIRSGRPLPDIPETNASKSGRERVIDLARRENLTVRQLAQRLGGYGGLAFVGTPATIADQMEEWLVSEASDGFNVMFPYLPEGLDDFVDRVVPELQRRGIFRREYEGRTLRENLGLPRPENRFFRADREAGGASHEIRLADARAFPLARARHARHLRAARAGHARRGAGLPRGLAHRAQLHRRERLRGPDSVRRRARHAHAAHPHRLCRHPDGAAAPGAARHPAVAARQSHARAPRHRRRPRLDLQRVRVHRLRPQQRRRARAHGRGARRDDAGLDGNAARPQGQVLHGAPARAAARARAAAAPADLAQRGVGRLVPHLRREGRADPDRAPADRADRRAPGPVRRGPRRERTRRRGAEAPAAGRRDLAVGLCGREPRRRRGRARRRARVRRAAT